MHLVYDYYGLEIAFSTEAGLPIVVHAIRNNRKSSMVLRFSNGLLETPESLDTDHPLDEDDYNTFKLLIEKNASELIKAWLDIFLYSKPLEPEIIKQKISN